MKQPRNASATFCSKNSRDRDVSSAPHHKEIEKSHQPVSNCQRAAKNHWIYFYLY